MNVSGVQRPAGGGRRRAHLICRQAPVAVFIQHDKHGAQLLELVFKLIRLLLAAHHRRKLVKIDDAVAIGVHVAQQLLQLQGPRVAAHGVQTLLELRGVDGAGAVLHRGSGGG